MNERASDTFRLPDNYYDDPAARGEEEEVEHAINKVERLGPSADGLEIWQSSCTCGWTDTVEAITSKVVRESLRTHLDEHRRWGR